MGTAGSAMVRPKGLTLVEMMFSTALIAILGTLAVPSFRDLIYNTERTTTVNNYFHSLFLARSESVKRGEVVSLCRSSDAQTCATRTAAWTVGWIVFVNTDRDEPAERDEAEQLLAVYEGWPNGSITSNRLTYSFRPHVQGVVNGTIIFCDPRGAEQARAIIISHTGRPRVARKDASGKPLRCM
jgi:type IV fimbrial biogenesis protein FimT